MKKAIICSVISGVLVTLSVQFIITELSEIKFKIRKAKIKKKIKGFANMIKMKFENDA